MYCQRQNRAIPPIKNSTDVLTLPNTQRAQGLPAFTKITAFQSCHKLVKIQLQNFDQTSATKP